MAATAAGAPAAAETPAATQRALELLAPDARPATPRLERGYLDLLGSGAPEATGTAQRLMFTGAVPAIYERWWRPGLGRIAKGLFGPGMEDEHRIAADLLGLGRGDRVLDIACGPGNFTRGFAGSVGAAGLAVGIDASVTMLDRAVRDTSASNVAYVRGDAVALPFSDGAFDGVCCFAALHMFAEPFAALDHMTRVLGPGGRIAILTSCRLRTGPLRALDGLAGLTSGQRMFEPDEITGALRARGFADVRQRVSGLTQFVGARFG